MVWAIVERSKISRGHLRKISSHFLLLAFAWKASPAQTRSVDHHTSQSGRHVHVSNASEHFTVDLTQASRIANRGIVIANEGTGNVTDPWVVANGKRDWFDTPAIIREAVGDENDPQLKAFRIWSFIRDNRYHWYPAEAGPEIHDPVKFLNVYGYGLCDDCASNAEAMFKQAGFTRARCWGLSGHVVPEVFYAGAWHMLDPDLGFFYPFKNGPASVNECERNGVLVRRISGPSIEKLYTTTKNNEMFENRWSTTHTMALTLRPGEKLERYWDNWKKFHDNYLIQEPPQYGNGRIQWAPALNTPFFKQGCAEFVNIATWDETRRTPNIHLASAGQPGTIIFNMPSPYPFVGGQLQLEALANTSLESITIEFSRDGINWLPVGQITGPFAGRARWDLDSHLAPLTTAACYGFKIRLSLTGSQPESVGLSTMQVTGEIQCAPAALPTLEPGKINDLAVRMQTSPGGKLRIEQLYDYSDAPQQPLDPPRPLLPIKGERVMTAVPMLVWQTAPALEGGPREHQILVSYDRQGYMPVAPPLDRILTRSSYWTVPSGWLQPGRGYYWKVRARDDNGEWGEWSEPQDFAITKTFWRYVGR